MRGLIDRYIERYFVRASMFKLARSRIHLLDSLSTVPSRTNPSSTNGCVPAGRAIWYASSIIPQSRNEGSHRGVATFRVALAETPGWRCAEDRTLHLQRDKAYLQVRRQVGLPRREPDGRKARRVTAWLTKRARQPVQLTVAGFFALLARLGLREKLAVAFAGWLGPRISDELCNGRI